MALDINGYNASFNAFVKFADGSMRTNAKAVARFGEGGAQPLEGRTIVAVDPKTDKVGKWGRSLVQQDLNNKIRTAFRNAIIDMFGGERRSPRAIRRARCPNLPRLRIFSRRSRAAPWSRPSRR